MPAKKVRFYQFTGFSVCLSVSGFNFKKLGTSRRTADRIFTKTLSQMCLWTRKSSASRSRRSNTEKENFNLAALFTVANGRIPCRRGGTAAVLSGAIYS